MQKKYEEAKNEAASRGAEKNVEEFEQAADKTRAVINRPIREILKLIDDEVYPTYYHLSEVIKPQTGEKWDSLRQAADVVFFTGYHKEIRFAVLSMDSGGLKNYGDCSIVLREQMISRRATVFVANTTLYYMNNPDIRGAEDIPLGLRAVWNDRAKLCVVKLAEKLDKTTTPDHYSGILLHQGADSAEDDFIEVHIFGSMTIRTIEEIAFNPVPETLNKREKLTRTAQIEGIKEKAEKYGVKVN